MTHLQVALDLLSMEDALTIAQKAYMGGADWLEAGTPLIKNHGMPALRKLRQAIPEVTMVADLKTADTGDIEVEMAANSGADIVTVLALADDFTVKRAVNQAKAHGIKIMVDLLEVEDKVSRAKELEKLGVDYILIHTPIDLQKVKMERVDSSLEELKRIKQEVHLPIAAAGGITPETASILKREGVEVFIVGSAITKAKDIEAKTREFCRIIGVKVKQKEERKLGYREIVEGFNALSTPFITDAQHRFGAMRGMNPLFKGIRVAGRAFTVKTLGGDWGKVVKAIDMAEAGDIIVVDAQASEAAVWGELATRSAMAKGIKAAVIDGAVRDSDDISEIGFPIWARYISPNAGEPHGHGKLQMPVACAGQVVMSGDIIVADEVGVVVVPREEAQDILTKAQEVADKEKRYRKEIAEGRSLAELFGL